MRAAGRDDGTGRRSGLKIRRWQHRGGSIPPPGTNDAANAMSYRLGDFDYRAAAGPDRAGPGGASAPPAACCTSTDCASPTTCSATCPRCSRPAISSCSTTRASSTRASTHARPSGGRVELLVERIVGDDEAWVQLRASHAPKVGRRACGCPAGATARVVARDDRFFRLRSTCAVRCTTGSSGTARSRCRRTSAARRSTPTRARYQTVYAREPGAVAAPTAGLHFDDALLAALAARGVARAYVTLHVGAGTFLPVQHDDLAQHRMHAEWYTLPPRDRRGDRGRARARRPRRRRRHDDACARSSRPRATTAGCAQAPRRDRAVHHARLPLPRRRSAGHQLPPAAHRRC